MLNKKKNEVKEKMGEKGEQGRGEVTVKLSGNELKQVLEIRGRREKHTGKPTSIAELVREAIRDWYNSKIGVWEYE